MSSVAPRLTTVTVDFPAPGDPTFPAIRLVPRYKDQGYSQACVNRRRWWTELQTGCALPTIGSYAVDSASMQGNIENPIGTAQVPLGVAGPLLVHGTFARGVFYVPLATTEGALVRSYERGMVTLTRSGGVSAHVVRDENCVAPVFCFEDVTSACQFTQEIHEHWDELCARAESTTRHGKLLRIEAHQSGCDVAVTFRYHTADAHGMNMMVRATEAACKWLVAVSGARRYYILSGFCSEKRASGMLCAGGKGKTVVAGARLGAEVLRTHLHVSPSQLFELWHHNLLAQTRANVSGYNGHHANGLAALFIACGQDVANVVNCAVGITAFEVTSDGDLYASVTLPSLTVGTVGGGTGIGTSRECLEMMGCYGSGRAGKFAEIIAATLLAGELSMAAALTGGEFVAAHEAYGRNRPTE